MANKPVKSRETPRQLEAFERYVSLGKERSLDKLKQVYKEYRMGTLGLWSGKFDWQNRVEERDKQIAEKAEKITDNKLAKDISAHRTKLLNTQAIVYKAIEGVVVTDKETGKKVINPKVIPDSARGLKELSDGLTNLTKLDAQLAGFKFGDTGGGEGQTNNTWMQIIQVVNQKVVVERGTELDEAMEIKEAENV